LGRGWWVAGVEQLFFLTGNRILWLGGEGSSRVYEPSGTDLWRAANLDRADALTKLGTTYTRELPNGLRVQFNASGRHVATVNRLGQITSFRYDAGTGDTLKTIKLALPPNGADGITGVVPDSVFYAFDYSAVGKVVVVAPSADTILRRDTLWLTGARLDSIVDPDGKAVRFDYHPNIPGLILGRTDKLKHRAGYGYDDWGRGLSTLTIPLGQGQPAIVTEFHPAEVAGINHGAARSPSVPADSAYTLLNGPRRDTTVTRFWVNQYGAPYRVKNALGFQTIIERGDMRWPAAVTRLRQPSGQVVAAVYDNRGNLLESTDSSRSRVINGKKTYATTRYVWHSKWDDVIRTLLPEGELFLAGFDQATGNRIWEQPGIDQSRRSNFFYYATGLYKETQEPGTSARDLVLYDKFGNLSESRTPRGIRTTLSVDGIGRPVARATWIDTTGTQIQRDSTGYDRMGRPVRTVGWGPAMNGAPAQKLVVWNSYDAAGQLESLQRSDSSATSVVGPLTTRWVYDSAGRRVKEISPDNQADSTVYDAAGNVVKLLTRRTDEVAGTRISIEMHYDALNRLLDRQQPAVNYKPRHEGLPSLKSVLDSNPDYPHYPSAGAAASGGYTIPADLATFSYDSAGNLTRADNQDARILRSYDPDGRLRGDTLIIRTWQDMRDSTWTRHVYELIHSYDLNGRPIDLQHPVAIDPQFGSTLNSHTRYGYDPLTGGLASITDPLQNEYDYEFDLKGQLAALRMPRGIYEQYQYDDDGNLTYLLVSGPGGDWRRTTMRYDGRGKRIFAQDSVMSPASSFVAAYSGLGHLVSDTLSEIRPGPNGPVTTVTQESFANDAFGNMTHKTSMIDRGGTKTSSIDNSNRFDRATGRQYRESSGSGTSETSYDLAGNVTFVTRVPATFSTSKSYNDRASYYGADGKLRAADWRTFVDLDDSNGPKGPFKTTFEEFRYDALGRRVAVLARRWCNNDVIDPFERMECKESYIRRTVWDHDRELYEIQMPANSTTAQDTIENDEEPVHRLLTANSFDPNPLFGRVAYTYGFGIDRPLAVTRMNYADAPNNQWAAWAGAFTIVPKWNERDEADDFYVAEATTTKVLCYSNTTRCIMADLPVMWSAFYPEQRLGYPSTWSGTLLQGKRDASGTMYRRNRSYDPASGRFTQEDPIGLAGGVNLYGFAAGDPVNYSDPFGLCPIEKDGIPCTATYARGVTVSSAKLRGFLDDFAAEQNTELLVYSGDRDPSRNARAGGAKRSAHLRGEAADVKLVGKSHRQTADALFHSEVRKADGVRLLYHQPGATLPEHSHVDLQTDIGDRQERPQAKGSRAIYDPLQDPIKHPQE
jgi:RHS repeat-associated protein